MDAKLARSILRGMKAEIPPKKQLQALIEEAQEIAASLYTERNQILDDADLARMVNREGDRIKLQRGLAEIEQRYFKEGAGWQKAMQEQVQLLELREAALKQARRGLSFDELEEALGRPPLELTQLELQEIVDSADTIAAYVVEKLFNEGLTKRNEVRVAMRDAWVLEEYRQTMDTLLDYLAAGQTYGKRREELRLKITRLKDRRHFKGMHSEIKRILTGIYEGRVQETRESLLDKAWELTKPFSGRMKSRQAEVSRKVSARIHTFYKMIRGSGKTKGALAMSPQEVDAEIARIQHLLENPDAVLPKHNTPGEKQQEIEEETDRLHALIRFGALKHRADNEIAEAVEWLEEHIIDEMEAQEARREALEEEASAFRKRLSGRLTKSAAGRGG